MLKCASDAVNRIVQLAQGIQGGVSMQFAFSNDSCTTYSLAAVFFLAVQHPTAAETRFRGFCAGVRGGRETYDVGVRSRNLAADDLDLSDLSGGF